MALREDRNDEGEMEDRPSAEERFNANLIAEVQRRMEKCEELRLGRRLERLERMMDLVLGRLRTPTTESTEARRGHNAAELAKVKLERDAALLRLARIDMAGWPTPQSHDEKGARTPEQIAVMRAKGTGPAI